MTPVTPLLVRLTVSLRSTLTHTPLTSLQVTQLVVTSTMLLVIRVLPLMTLDCSIVLMFLSRWFVPSVRTPSSQKLASKPVTGLSLTHSLKVLLKASEDSVLTPTVTTEELLLRTSCDMSGCCGAGCPTCPFRPPSRGSFLCLLINTKKECR